MRFDRIAALAAVGVTGLVTVGPAMAASDASTSAAVANQAVASVAAPVAASQTAGLIGGAVGSAVGGAVGGSVGGGTVGGPVSKLFNTREAGAAGGAMPAKLGLWAQGTWVNLRKSESSLGMDGNVLNTVFGVDYKFTDTFLAGVAFGYENVDIKTKFNSGTYKADGYTLAPYLGVSLSPNWSVDLSGGYTWLNYDVSRTSGAVKGSFDGGRWFGASNLTGSYAIDRWRLSPKVGVMYLREMQNAYNDTGTSTSRNAAQGINFGRASGGLKTGYAFDGFTPFVKLTGEWDFVKPKAVLKSNGQMSAVDDGGGVAGLGVDFGGAGPWSGTVEGSYNSIGRTDLDVWQGTASIRYQF
jgi:uncharacterized protein with beta-barrel porin domain